MLDVSFLSFPEQPSGELDSVAVDEVSELQPLSIDTLSDLPVETSEDRTRSWICVSPDVDESLGDGAESGMEDETPHPPPSGSDQPTPERSELDPADDDENKKERERKTCLQEICVLSDPHETCADFDTLISVPELDETGPHNSISPTTVTDSQKPTQDLGTEMHIVRTRTGGVVKAVSRLMENVVQKPFTRSGVGGFNRRAQSLCTLF